MFLILWALIITKMATDIYERTKVILSDTGKSQDEADT